MIDHRAERMLELLEQLVASHTAAALCLEEMRSLAAARTGEGSNTLTRPVVDHAALSIQWRDKVCRLGCTMTFRLFDRLARRPNCYIGYEQPLADVWEGRAAPLQTMPRLPVSFAMTFRSP